MNRHGMQGQESPPIVLVELGRPIPKFVKKNLQYLRRRFPSARLILITDQNENLDNVEVVKTSSMFESTSLKEFDALDKIMTSTLQKNYWVSTTRRFFYLEAFMSQFNFSRIIHIESDMLILNLDALYFEANLDFDLAFSMQNMELGCAGIFFVNSILQLRNFVGFIIEHWEEQGVTDMTLLARFFHLNIDSNRIRILSPTPTLMAAQNQTGSRVYLFDPGDFGIYYFGNDARHNRIPIRKIRQVSNLNSFSQLQQYYGKTRARLHYLNNSVVSLELKVGDEDLKFSSIHMHSKTLPRNLAELKILLVLRNASHRYRLMNYIIFPTVALDLDVLIERLISFLVKRGLLPLELHDFRRR